MAPPGSPALNICILGALSLPSNKMSAYFEFTMVERPHGNNHAQGDPVVPAPHHVNAPSLVTRHATEVPPDDSNPVFTFSSEAPR